MHFLILNLSLMALFLVSPLNQAAAEPMTTATIEVTGRGSVMERPDRAELTFTIETNATNASDAIRQNASQAEKLMTVLKQKKGPIDRIATMQFHLYPVYDPKSRSTPASFRVNNTLRLETTEVDKLGPLMDAAAEAGSGRIGRLRFSHSQMDVLARKAAVQATEDARRIAEELARAAGVTITRILKIRYSSQPSPGPMRAEMGMSRKGTPIEVGDLKIERQVTLIFAIE